MSDDRTDTVAPSADEKPKLRVTRVPFEELALSAAEVGDILGYSARTVVESVASRVGFPKRLTLHPATWRAGDVIEWRDLNRAGRKVHRRSSGNTAKVNANLGVR